MKNRKPIIKVLVFTLCLIVFVGVLTIERNIILAKESSQENLAQNSVPESKASSTIKKNPAKLNFEEIGYDISDLLESEMVQDLPKEAVIELNLGDEYYTVSRDAISAGRPSNPDLTISLPAGYVNQISAGLCEMIKKANENGDFAIEMHSSQTALMWKYKGMLKYKECLG